MSLKFIAEAANVVLVGPNGVEKSMMVKNVAHQALIRGHKVRDSPPPVNCWGNWRHWTARRLCADACVTTPPRICWSLTKSDTSPIQTAMRICFSNW